MPYGWEIKNTRSFQSVFIGETLWTKPVPAVKLPYPVENMSDVSFSDYSVSAASEGSPNISSTDSSTSLSSRSDASSHSSYSRSGTTASASSGGSSSASSDSDAGDSKAVLLGLLYPGECNVTLLESVLSTMYGYLDG